MGQTTTAAPVSLSLTSILEFPGLSSGAQRALAGLLSFRNRDTGQCNPKLATLCERLRAPERTVCRWTRELRLAGVLAATKHRGASSYKFALLKTGENAAGNPRSENSSVAKNGNSSVAKNGNSGPPYPYMNLFLFEQERVPRIPPKKSYSSTSAREPTMNERVLAAYYAEKRRKVGG